MSEAPVIKTAINFNNYGIVNGDNRPATVQASETVGINIYAQKFVENDMGLTLDDLKTIIGKLIKFNVENPEQGKTYELEFIPDGESTNVIFNGLKVEKSQENQSVYNIQKNQIIVFECTSNYTAEKKSYYCYFKDSSAEEGEDGNVWLIYVYGKGDGKENRDDFRYTLFDLQDNLEPTITFDLPDSTQAEISEIGTNNIPVSIITGNFTLKNKSNGVYEFSNIELTNTSFNLPIDIKQEKDVTMKPIGYFKIEGKTN